MKKLMFTLAFAAFFIFNHATAQKYEKGTSVANLGVGVGVFSSISLSASFEKGFFPIGEFGVIGLGALAGVRTYNTNVLLTGGARYSTIGVGPRGTFHFVTIPVENLDVYAAVQILFGLSSINYDDNFFEDTRVFNVSSGAVAGARYYFKDSLAVFGEVGYGLSYLTGGISLKL